MENAVPSSTHCSCCILRESDPPSLSHFRIITPEKENYIARIDADVADNHGAIIELLNQQAALNRQRNTFVPAVNLPPEVLTTVFEFACCRIQCDWYWNLHPNSACAVTPLFIGTICSAWRSIAWGSPQLWNNITLIYSDNNAEKSAELLDYCLAKSGALPLTVELTEHEDQWLTGKSTKVIDVIVAYAHRLHTLDLFLPGPWEDALIRIGSCAPLLTRLSLNASVYADEDYPSIELTGRDMFANAMQLREVTLCGYGVADVLLPWTQLESLEVRSGDENDIFEFVETLRLCLRLRRCKINISGMTWGTSLSPSMTHATLEELEISGRDIGPLAQLFKMVELPALRSFALHLFTRPREWGPWLPSFLSHVTGTLETLRLSPAALLSEELLGILRAVPRLRKLELVNSNMTGQEKPMKLTQKVLDLMNPSKYEGLGREEISLLDGQCDGDEVGMLDPDDMTDSHCLVPNLETIDYEGEIDFTPHALVEFLAARWGGPSSCAEFDGSEMQTASKLPPARHHSPVVKLRSVKFNTPYWQPRIQFDDPDATVVRRLQLEGMDLKFL